MTTFTTECDLKYCMEMNPNMAEVVRCKDCKKYDPEGSCDDSYGFCDCHGHDMSDEDYCSWGERR